MIKYMRFISIVMLAAPAGLLVAQEATSVTIIVEATGLPAGSACKLDVGAEYRVVHPRVSREQRGRFVALTDDMATFVAVAPERQAWNFVSDAVTTRSRRELRFTLPADLPLPEAGSFAAVYVPVRYAVTIPGKPPAGERETTFKLPLDQKAAAASGCLRLEVINSGKSLRVGMLPACDQQFPERTVHVTSGN